MRYYEMGVAIAGYNPDNRDAIKAAADEEWDFDDWDDYPEEISARGRGGLYGGESEEAFAERLTHAIWRANGAYCSVEVTCTYLDDLPCETYEYGEADYVMFVNGD